MKANELMIGDWVFCTYPSINKPVRVAEIKTAGSNELKIVIIDGIPLVFADRYIDPIPLTPEIMEKNFPGPEVIVWWPFLDGFHCETQTYGDIMVSGNFRYANQLQHALRLCWIDADIVI